MKDHLDTILDTSTPRQSTAERKQLWVRVAKTIPSHPTLVVSVPSPYQRVLLSVRRGRVYLAGLLIFILGTGGTVAAAETARPGDLLFPVEQATEQVRLQIASPEKRSALQSRFLDKRFAEVEELFFEASGVSPAAAEQMISLEGEVRIAEAIAVLLAQAERQNVESHRERLQALLETVVAAPVAGQSGRIHERRITIRDNRFEIRTETKQFFLDRKQHDDSLRYDDDKDEYDDEGETEGRVSIEASNQDDDDESGEAKADREAVRDTHEDDTQDVRARETTDALEGDEDDVEKSVEERERDNERDQDRLLDKNSDEERDHDDDDRRENDGEHI